MVLLLQRKEIDEGLYGRPVCRRTQRERANAVVPSWL